MNMLFLNTINAWLKEKNDSLSLFKLPNELGSVQNICNIKQIKIIVLALKLICSLVLLL